MIKDKNFQPDKVEVTKVYVAGRFATRPLKCDGQKLIVQLPELGILVVSRRLYPNRAQR